MVTTTRYSVIFQKIPSRVRVAQKIPSSIRVAGTRWGLHGCDTQYLCPSFPKSVSDGEVQITCLSLLGLGLTGAALRELQAELSLYTNLADSDEAAVAHACTYFPRLFAGKITLSGF